MGRFHIFPIGREIYVNIMEVVGKISVSFPEVKIWLDINFKEEYVGNGVPTCIELIVRL